MSRGTTRRSALGRRTRTVPNSSRSVTNARPSGPPTKPPLRLRSIERDRAGRRRLAHPPDDRDRVAGLAEQVGQPRRLVRGEDDPGVVGPPRLDGLDEATGTAGRQDGLAPAERVARRERRRGPSRRPRAGPTPRSARASATRRGGPSSRAAAGRSPASPSAARRPRPARRGARRPGATGTRRPRRCRRARRGRSSVPGPMWSRPVAGARWAAQTSAASPTASARARRLAPSRPRSTRFCVEPGEVRGEALRESRGGPAEAVADRGGAAGRQQELGRGQQDGPLDRARRCAGRSGRTSAASRSRRRRTRSGSAAPSTAGRRRRSRRAARTRRGRRPR